jgi:uncharacterized protein YbjT (DUF2867 family)
MTCSTLSRSRRRYRASTNYLLNAVTPDELTQGLIAYDLAKKRRLSHVVYHSVFRVEHFRDVPHFASKLAIENAIRGFDVPFTIIRPNYIFQNDASFRDTAITLTSDKHFGRTYNVNGPAIVSGPKAASIWSKVLGKEIKYAGDNLDTFEEQNAQARPLLGGVRYSGHPAAGSVKLISGLSTRSFSKSTLQV